MKVLVERLVDLAERIVSIIESRAGSSPTQMKIRSAEVTASASVLATVALPDSVEACAVARDVVRLYRVRLAWGPFLAMLALMPCVCFVSI